MNLIMYVLMLSPAIYFLIHWYRSNGEFRQTVKVLGIIFFYFGIVLMTMYAIIGILVEVGIIKL